MLLMDTKAKIYAYYSREVSVEGFEIVKSGIDEIVGSLTGHQPFANPADENITHCTDRDDFKWIETTYIPLKKGKGEVKVKLSGSYFKKTKKYPERYGYGVEVHLRGNKKAVREGFRTLLEEAEYPDRIEYPLYLADFLEKLDTTHIDDEITQGWTNHKGWRIAKQVIEEKNATLKKIYQGGEPRFPYNVMYGPSWGEIEK